MLDEKVPLVLGRLAVLGPDDAGGSVQVEHVDQLLLLLLQLLDLSLQIRVHHLQLLGLLTTEEERERGIRMKCLLKQNVLIHAMHNGFLSLLIDIFFTHNVK